MTQVEKTDNRSIILRHAEDIFYKYGFNKAIIDDIITASGISNGTFYHYFRNKSVLGHALLMEFQKRHRKVMLFFPDEEPMVLSMLNILVYWYIYFQTPQLRRFMYEVRMKVDLGRENDMISNACLTHSKKTYSSEEIDLKFAAITGIRNEIIHLVYEKTERYSCSEISLFIINQICSLFEVPKKNTTTMFNQASELFQQLDIKIGKSDFSIDISRKH